MISKPAHPIILIRIFIVLLGIFNVYFTIILLHSSKLPRQQYTYLNDDFPAEFEAPGLHSKVSLVNEQQTVHYQLTSSIADEEWANLVAMLVRLGPHYRPFAITMMHTMHCLDKLRRSIPEKPRTSVGTFHVEHCANYVRESILCAADTTLEPIGDAENEKGAGGGDFRVLPVTRECRDWSAVYQEVKSNHESFVNAAVAVPY